MKITSGIVAVMLVLAGNAGGAQTADERSAARASLARNGDALVTVTGTLKARMNRGGRDNAAPDSAVRAPGTIIDPSGLVVLALSSIDPAETMSRTAAFANSQQKITSELLDVKIRFADGKEVPAKVVLRDSDLDLIFVRPATAPASPVAAVTSTAGTLAAMDAVVVAQRGGDLTSWKPIGTLGIIQAVIDKPRQFYLVAAPSATTMLGSAVFDLKGQFAGLLTLRATEDAKNNVLNGMQGGQLEALGLVPLVVPAADIREIAKQAK